MIFFSKRHNVPGQPSTTEACVSIIGLFLAIGLIGGLGALIYGLVRGNMSGTIGGAVALGVSFLFSIILALVFVYCLKNNNVNSDADERRSVPHHNKHMRHHNQQRRQTREQTSSHEITVISGVHKFDNHQQYSPNGHDHNHVSPPIQSFGLSDSTNSGYGRQLPQTPSKTSSFNFNQNQQSNMRRDNYNRH